MGESLNIGKHTMPTLTSRIRQIISSTRLTSISTMAVEHTRETYAQAGDTANTGVQEVSPFLQWLQENNYKGYVGELGVPSNNSTTLSGFLC